MKLFKKKQDTQEGTRTSNKKKNKKREITTLEEPKRESYMDKISLEGFNIPVDIRDRGYQIEQRAGKEYPFRSY
ncbi:hypothetical protein OSJ97_25135, partial [Escherichia coli]|nr:hypothetical protein [Escherichia coli]